jgi:uncharacterized protein
MLRCAAAFMVPALACAPAPAIAADYAPLDCGKAQSPAERTICGSYALGQSEARMATLYSVATSLVAMGQRGDIQDTQRAWLARRDLCGTNHGCLAATYDERIRALDQVIAGVASRGPY